jgi:ketosteroid isomerase-like protein
MGKREGKTNVQIKAWITGLSLVMACVGASNAQQASDIDAIKSANQAFYAAFSARDLKAMEDVWEKRSHVIYYNPRTKDAAVGYDEVMDAWASLFDRLSKITISTSDVKVRTDGKLAWVVAIESAEVQPSRGGEPQKINTVATNVFEKLRGHWLMISHQAQMIPE